MFVSVVFATIPIGLFPVEVTWNAFFFLFGMYGGGPALYVLN